MRDRYPMYDKLIFLSIFYFLKYSFYKLNLWLKKEKLKKILMYDI